MTTTLDATKTLAAAKQYRDAGISFIPLRYVPGDVEASKIPASDALIAVNAVNDGGKPSWAGYQHRLPTDPELTTWFGNGKTRNIAIILGEVSRNLVAVDFDTEAAYHAWAAAYPLIASKTATQKTGKGFHVLFRLPHAPGNSKFDYAGAEHDIKGEGGYVVAYPSVHGSGRKYEWLPGLAPWEIGVMFLSSLADVGIIAKHADKTPPPAVAPPANGYNPLEILKAISAHPDPATRQKLMAAVEPVLVKTNDPKPVEVLSADTILTTNWGDPAWAIPGLLPVGLTLLAGRPKLGKSWLALQLAQSVASGGKVFDKDVERGPVLYLALEDTPRRLRDRMNKQNWPAGLPADFITLGDFDKKIGSFANGGADLLAALIQSKGYRLVIIDTLARALRNNKIKDAKSSVEMTAALAPIQEMAHKCNCAVMMIDHMRKVGGADPDVITDTMDSISKGGVADTAWGLYRERGKTEAKLQITGRDVDEVTLAIKMDWLTACWQCEGDYYAMKMTERRQEILDALELLGGATLTKLAEAIGQDKGNTKKRLSDLVVAGLVTQSIDDEEITYKKRGV